MFFSDTFLRDSLIYFIYFFSIFIHDFYFFIFFFFQAEDGIRDIGVTGVQTCALPIYLYFKTAESWYTRTLDLAGETKDRKNQLEMYRALARVEQARENRGKQEALLNDALVAARDLKDKKAEGEALHELANLEEARNNWKKAVNYRSQQVKALLEAYADHPEGLQTDLANGYGGLAWGEVLTGDFENAIGDARRGLGYDRDQNWINVNL